MTRDIPKATEADTGKPFQLNAELVAKGRQLFATIGCANCHALKEDNKVIASEKKAKSLDKLPASGGCLAAEAQVGMPFYQLTPLQRSATGAAIAALV